MYYVRVVTDQKNQPRVMEELARHGIRDLHSIESEHEVEVCGFCDEKPYGIDERNIEQVEPINWEAQWELHAPGFVDGQAHLMVANQPIALLPGPGFGDLSHPTTKLCLELLEERARGLKVLDIGCGSGVLSVAAHAAGADQVYGLDIDPAAVQHASENALNNGMDIQFGLAEQPLPFDPDLTLMNMTPAEQKQAFRPLVGMWITSGIPSEQKAHYLEWVDSIGLEPLFEQELEGWLGFILAGKHPSQDQK